MQDAVKCHFNAVPVISIAYGTVITMAESDYDFRITKGTPYLTPMGKLWGVYCENLGENWPHYNDTTL